MKLHYFLLLSLVLILPSCGNRPFEDSDDSLLYDFAQSVKIIRTLIETKSINSIIEDGANQEDVEFLIENLSPAEFAFESEVLNCTMPVLVYYYENQIHDLPILEALAEAFKDQIKIVMIDAMKFPKIIQKAELEKLPMFILLQNHKEILRIDGIASTDEIKKALMGALCFS